MKMAIKQHCKNSRLQFLLQLALIDQGVHNVSEEGREVQSTIVEHHAALLDLFAQLHQGVEVEGGNVRTSPVTTLSIKIFLILDPPGTSPNWS